MGFVSRPASKGISLVAIPAIPAPTAGDVARFNRSPPVKALIKAPLKATAIPAPAAPIADTPMISIEEMLSFKANVAIPTTAAKPVSARPSGPITLMTGASAIANLLINGTAIRGPAVPAAIIAVFAATVAVAAVAAPVTAFASPIPASAPRPAPPKPRIPTLTSLSAVLSLLFLSLTASSHL